MRRCCLPVGTALLAPTPRSCLRLGRCFSLYCLARSGLVYLLAQRAMSEMVCLCYASQGFDHLVKVFNFFEVAGSNMLAATNLTMCVNLAFIIKVMGPKIVDVFPLLLCPEVPKHVLRVDADLTITFQSSPPGSRLLVILSTVWSCIPALSALHATLTLQVQSPRQSSSFCYNAQLGL